MLKDAGCQFEGNEFWKKSSKPPGGGVLAGDGDTRGGYLEVTW